MVLDTILLEGGKNVTQGTRRYSLLSRENPVPADRQERCEGAWPGGREAGKSTTGF